MSPGYGNGDDLTDEAAYERVRTDRLRDMSRRGLLRLGAGIGLGAGLGAVLPGGAHAAEPAADGIVKPLPSELLIPHGTNAEMRWEAMRGQGYLTPVDRFFVRNHTSTPRIDARTWRLRLWGTGLHGSPAPERPVEFSYEDLLALRAETLVARIECAGNARGLFTSQQGQEVAGTPWRLGAVGLAHWRGVRLSTVLERAGLTAGAVDVLPRGLDADYVRDGENLGRVRRPLPIAKALDDVLLAYEMNGAPVPPDHGHPVRLVVPSWVGIASVKWLGDIQVAAEPLFSPWNTRFYRYFGPDYPPGGSDPLTSQNVKSAFELPWDATVPAGRRVLHGRSWSGTGRIRRTEVSTDGGASWRRARPQDRRRDRHGWTRWELPWDARPGRRELLARAVDETGATQSAATPYNKNGYLFGAVVRHPVTVA